MDQRYKFNEVELQTDLDLGVYMTDFRMFDPTVARLWQIDPIDKEDRSPYSWVLNNPILYNDILGLDTVRYDELDDTPIDVDEDVVILDELTIEAERLDISDEDTYLVPGFGYVKKGEKILPHQDGVPGFEDFFGKRKVGHGRLTFTVDVEGRLEGLSPVQLEAPDISGRGGSIKAARTIIKGIKQAKNLSPQKLKSIKSLYKRMTEHIKKLRDYRNNPHAFDNQGHLKNAPDAQIRQKIIDSRINHLKTEINTFYNNIIKILNGN